MMSDIKYLIGSEIMFRYKNRQVWGEILGIGPKHILVKLFASYSGKNDTWYSGELKIFQKKNITNFQTRKYPAGFKNGMGRI